MSAIRAVFARSLKLYSLGLLTKIRSIETGISAREALATDPLTESLYKLGVAYVDMERIVQRAARLEAHGISDQDVDRIVREWHVETAHQEAVERLDRLDGLDPERDRDLADDILYALAPQQVRDAYDDAQERAGGWFWS